MKAQDETRRQITSLIDYKKRKDELQKQHLNDPSKILDEVSYYLLMAAKAMSAHIRR